MGNFSVSKVFASGVGLIERRGGTVLGWGIAAILLSLVPRVLSYALAGDLQSLFSVEPSVSANTTTTHAADLHSFFTQMQAQQAASQAQAGPGMHLLVRLWPIWFLWWLLSSAVLHNAVYRTWLQPARAGFAGLRLGAAEFWQALVMFCQSVVCVVAALSAFAVFLLVGLIAKLLPGVLAGWVVYLAMVILGGLAAWVCLRLSMAGPMTFAEGKFRLFESWALTKGRSWKLLWTLILPWALMLGLYLFLLFAVLLLVITPVGLVAQTWAAVAPGVAAGPAVLAIGGLVYFVFLALVSGVVQSITFAPWAAAYGELTGSTPE